MSSFWTEVVPILEIVSSVLACFFAIILTGKDVKKEGVELKQIDGVPQYVSKSGLNRWGKFSRATLIVTTAITLAINVIKQRNENLQKEKENERLSAEKKDAQERYTNSITLQHYTLDSLRIIYDSISKSLEQQSLLQRKSDGILNASDQLTSLQLNNLKKQKELLFNTKRNLDPFYPFRIEYSVGLDLNKIPNVIRDYLKQLNTYVIENRPKKNENLQYEFLNNDSLDYIACRNLYSIIPDGKIQDANYYMFLLLFYSMPTLSLKIQNNLDAKADVYTSLFSFSMDFSLTDSLARNLKESTSEIYVNFRTNTLFFTFKRPVSENYYIQNKLRSVLDLEGKYILADARFGNVILDYKYLTILFHNGYNFTNRSLFHKWKKNGHNFFYHKIENKDLNQTNFEANNEAFTNNYHWEQK